MYRWWVLLHIAGAFGFVLAHGVSVAVTFRLRSERDRARILALLQMSGSTIVPMYAGLIVLVGAGVAAGFDGNWWGAGWIWAALGVLVATTGLMYAIARPYYQTVKEWVGLRPSGVPRVSNADLDERLRSARPLAIAVIGFASLAILLWLMVFKPF